MSWQKTVVISVLVLLTAAGLTAAIFSTEPTAARGGAAKKTAMLVDVTGVEHGTFRPLIVATGTVEAEQDAVLGARVGGEIVKRSPRFTPGQFVEEGETLARIDPSDYRNALQQRRAELRQALTQLNLEMGAQTIAEREIDLLDDDLDAEARARALRKPQLQATRAQVESARAAVQQAKVNLGRTTIRAPFAGQILRRDVSLGSQVAPGDPLGRLVGVDRYWVMVTVPQSKMRWLTFPDESGQQGSEVRVHNRAAWPQGVYRTGHLHRPVGALDDQTRMVRVIVAVSDPLARGEDMPEDAPALMVGEYLETRIRGEEIPDVIRLDRSYVRDEDTVWVMKDGELDIRDVTIVTRDQRYAYISEGLHRDDRIVTTNLSTVTDGAKLRVEGDEASSAGEQDGGSAG